MPIGIVTNEDFEKEVTSFQRNEVKPDEGLVKEESHGRNPGDNNVPESLRKIIGEEAVINGRQAALGLAGAFGISASSASPYARGATSTATYAEPQREIVGHLNRARRRAIKKATGTLNRSLGSITQEKLDYTDAKDLASIAKDMSVIIKNLEPQELPPPDSKAPQFVIFAPQFKSEKSYEVIDVSAKSVD